jgi:hypothetical protein
MNNYCVQFPRNIYIKCANIIEDMKSDFYSLYRNAMNRSNFTMYINVNIQPKIRIIYMKNLEHMNKYLQKLLNHMYIKIIIDNSIIEFRVFLMKVAKEYDMVFHTIV